MIDWNKYFDHIVILSAAGYDKRRDLLIKEFNRIGLTNYEFFINIYDNLLTDKFIENDINRICHIHGHYFIIKRAYELGWDSIWILEDDVRFLKDEVIIKSILNDFNSDKLKSNIYMFDWILFKKYDEKDFDYFGAASYWLDRKGMEFFIYVIEHYPIINDTWFMPYTLNHNEVSFRYFYNYDNESRVVDVNIQNQSFLPIKINMPKMRLCVQVDNDDNISKYYIPECEENTIDENLYQLYKKMLKSLNKI